MTSMTLSLHRSVQQGPNDVATIFGDRKKTWCEVYDRVPRFAAALRQLGVEREDRVAILSLNSDIYFEYYHAVPWAGAAVVPLNTRWAPAELAYGITDAECKLLLIDDAFVDIASELQDQCPLLKPCLYIGEKEAPDGVVDLRELMNDATGIEEYPREGSDLFGIFYTSGTTAQPKGVMLSHVNIWSSAVAVAAEVKFEQTDIYLHCAPMFHLADGVHGFAASLLSATHAFIRGFDPDGLIDAIEQDRVTHTLLVPTMIAALLANPRVQSADLSSLKAFTYGASPMTEDLLRKTIASLPNVDLFQGYGQTELAPTISILGPKDHVLDGPLAGRSRSVGQSSVGVRVKIADENGCELERGVSGEIWAQGPNVMLGYLNNVEETTRVLVDGWIRTGDAGYMSEDGYIYLVDRIKDMIITGGENVASLEVENVIAEHPSVSMCAVFGLPDEYWGETVHAVVVPAPGAEVTEAEVIEHCKKSLSGYKCPTSVDVRTEPLPLSGAGKVMKRQLKATYVRPDSQTDNSEA